MLVAAMFAFPMLFRQKVEVQTKLEQQQQNFQTVVQAVQQSNVNHLHSIATVAQAQVKLDGNMQRQAWHHS